METKFGSGKSNHKTPEFRQSTRFSTASSSFLVSMPSVLLTSQSLYSTHIINNNATLSSTISQPINHLKPFQQQASPTPRPSTNNNILSILHDLYVIDEAIAPLHDRIASLQKALPGVHVPTPPLHEAISPPREQRTTIPRRSRLSRPRRQQLRHFEILLIITGDIRRDDEMRQHIVHLHRIRRRCAFPHASTVCVEVD